jgi:hypothetical protein
VRSLSALFAALLASAAMCSGALAQAKPAMQHMLPDVKIDRCFITPPKLLSKKASGTQITYENLGRHTYSSVTFVVGYRNSESHFVRKVTDQGKFAPGAKIDHHFSLFSDVTYGGKATYLCGAVAAQR